MTKSAPHLDGRETENVKVLVVARPLLPGRERDSARDVLRAGRDGEGRPEAIM